MTLGTPKHQHVHTSQTANLLGLTAAESDFRSQRYGVPHVALEYGVHIYEVSEGLPTKASVQPVITECGEQQQRDGRQVVKDIHEE